MRKLLILMALLSIFQADLLAKSKKDITLRIVQTTDVHGSYFPYDFMNRRAVKGSLAQVSTYVKQLRRTHGEDNVILLDNGDILQGQPIAYYFNFIDTASTHVAADMLNYMKYDAIAIGNHDIETGHAVYDRWISQCRMPVLAANMIDTKTGSPYLPPYKVLHKGGAKVVVLGLTTPCIPSWLPKNLWTGLRFDDMVSTAKMWVKIIQEEERPDVLIGLFHSGSAGNVLGGLTENASKQVAEQVPGFDVIFMGHDHLRQCEKVMNVAGDSVLIIDPANAARAVADVTIRLQKEKGRVKKTTFGKLFDVTDLSADKAFMYQFQNQLEATKAFVSRRIGTIDKTISARESLFGSSAFIDLLHQLQLDLSQADISLCAPLSITSEIRQGDIHMSDMFSLYRFENMLYVMKLTGKEIKNYLEMSYALWTQQMISPSDHLLLLNDGENGFGRMKNPTYNFDSAAGIIYTVDVTQPEGEKVHIVSMTDGTPFDIERTYKVAVNSYRGNGGGDLLVKGAGIPKAELESRIVWATDKDLRYYLMKRIEDLGTLSPAPANNWKFIPENYVRPAIARDYRLIFGEERP